MAARKPTAQRRSAQKPKEPSIADAAKAVSEEQDPVGVFVIKIPGEDGAVSTAIQPIGVEVTEIATILELGLKAFRQQAGLDKAT